MSRALRNVLLGVTILFFVFAFRYTVPDRYAFFIPFYCAVSVFIGLGTHLFQRHRSGRVFGLLVLVFSLLPVGVYTAAPALAEKMQFNIGTRSDIPYRDDYKYFLQPWRTGDKGAERFAQEALDVKEKEAVIYADSTTVGPLLYVQEVKRKRPDVKIISSVIKSENAPGFDEQTIEQLLKERAIYVVSRRPRYCPAFVLDNYDLVPAGVLWRVVERGEKGSIEQRRQENMHTGKFGRIVFVFDEIQKETTLVSRYWAYRVGRYG
jgi:hypothetical protein